MKNIINGFNMINQQYNIGSLFDVKIKLQLTLFLLAGFFVLPSVLTGDLKLIINSILFFIYLILSIIAHEFGHIFLAKYYKYQCKEIIISFLGGMALISGLEKVKPKQDIVISLAGPMISCFLFLLFLPSLLFEPLDIQILKNICGLNFMLFIFNLFPIYPLDGGRIFKALLRLFKIRERNIIKISTIVNIILIFLLCSLFVLIKAYGGFIVLIFLSIMTYNEWRNR